MMGQCGTRSDGDPLPCPANDRAWAPDEDLAAALQATCPTLWQSQVCTVIICYKQSRCTVSLRSWERSSHDRTTFPTQCLSDQFWPRSLCSLPLSCCTQGGDAGKYCCSAQQVTSIGSNVSEIMGDGSSRLKQESVCTDSSERYVVRVFVLFLSQTNVLHFHLIFHKRKQLAPLLLLHSQTQRVIPFVVGCPACLHNFVHLW